MKYKDKYPYMQPISEEHNNIIRCREQRRCCVCGHLTEYVEINYEAFFCSEECLAVMDTFYKGGKNNESIYLAANEREK